MKPTTQINGTRRQGQVGVSYAEIVEILGEPHSNGDGYETEATWAFEKNGVVFTLYDWRDGKRYHGDARGLPVEEITQWYIGGYSPAAVAVVHELFPDCMAEEDWSLTVRLA